MAAADRAAIDGGSPAELLMDRAGRAVARAALCELGARYGCRAVVVCGKGNNGGDGFVAARVLRDEGVDVKCVAVIDLDGVSGPARVHLDRFTRAGGRVERFQPDLLDRADIFVDAIFGTGFTGSAGGDAARAIGWMNRAMAPVIAVDIPSGVNGSTGGVSGPAVRAVVTVAMGAEKIGTAVGTGATLAGRVEIADIGIPVSDPSLSLAEASDAAAALPRRKPGSHKRSSGSVAVLAGSDHMTGAPVLTARGSLRMGSGYVNLGTTEAVRRAAAAELPELIIDVVTEGSALGPDALEGFKSALERADVVVVGPGIGAGDMQRSLMERVIAEVELPVVVDADGLNVIARDTSIVVNRSAPLVLTPHPAELGRLLERSVDAIQNDRVAAVTDAATAFGCTVLLKGHRSVIAGEDGRAIVNPTGGPALATAGTGDVLAGAIGALVGHGLAPFEATWLGAYVHGVAGSIAEMRRGTSGVIATDVADALGEAADAIAEVRAWS
jgi:NAD(P)H-hydrate epimerase